jgi:hypothetical protein
MSRADVVSAARALTLTLVLGCGQQVGAQSVAHTASVAPLDPRGTLEVRALPEAASTASTAPPPPPPATEPARPVAPALATGRDALMDQLLGGGSAALKAVVAAPEKYRFQVLYAVVGQGATPTLERHSYRADAEYFFPASSMKVPIMLAAYDRLAVLRSSGKSGLTRDATLRIHPLDGTGDPFVTTLAREAWRALIVSDNFSANRLLAFVGHREVHEALWSRGLASARIHSGFATGDELDPATLSPRIEVTVQGSPTEIPARRSDLVLPPTNATGLAIGEASIVDGRRVPGPLSFAAKNAMRLRDLQDTLVRIMRPELLPPAAAAAAAAPDDLASLRQTLGTLPSESGLAGFDRNVVADYQLNPFLRGVERVRARGRFEIYSKVGQAFGFLVANVYVVDKETGRSFFLIASVYANPDETMNDDKYAYDTISFPALADVGEAFARHAFAR